MGVDGISGSGGSGLPEAPGNVEGSNVERPGESFSVEQAEGTATSDLDRVASGELSVDGYLDARVRAATSHLEGVLGPEQLADVQEQLREQLLTDPLLSRLVQRALGSTPAEPNRGQTSR